MGIITELEIKKVLKEIEKILDIYDAFELPNAEKERAYFEEIKKACDSRNYYKAFCLLCEREGKGELDGTEDAAGSEERGKGLSDSQ